MMLKLIKCVGFIYLDCSFFVLCENVILWIYSNLVRVRKFIFLKIIFVDDVNLWQWIIYYYYYYENCFIMNFNDILVLFIYF